MRDSTSRHTCQLCRPLRQLHNIITKHFGNTYIVSQKELHQEGGLHDIPVYMVPACLETLINAQTDENAADRGILSLFLCLLCLSSGFRCDLVACVKLVVPAFLIKQFLMCPAFDDPSLFQDKDAVTVLDS